MSGFSKLEPQSSAVELELAVIHNWGVIYVDNFTFRGLFHVEHTGFEEYLEDDVAREGKVFHVEQSQLWTPRKQ